jgi:hypothetical protein
MLGPLDLADINALLIHLPQWAHIAKTLDMLDHLHVNVVLRPHKTPYLLIKLSTQKFVLSKELHIIATSSPLLSLLSLLSSSSYNK